MRVAVIGSGPSGIYAASALATAAGRSGDGPGGQIDVDVIDRLPAPYGLVRYGVAPDHLKIKSITQALRAVLDRPGVRFLGNVEVGDTVTVEELAQFYDALVFAHGAAVDRRLGIPGEDLEGSFSATEFVSWYCGHPDAAVDRFALSARSVAVIGVGNVAVDVARILAKTPDELRGTDVPHHVLDVLERSHVEDIHMIGRRGPVQAKFTTKELRELGELANADIVVHPDELAVDAGSEEALASSPALRRNLDVLRDWSTREPSGRPRRLHLRFLLRPVALLAAEPGDAGDAGDAGEKVVAGLRVERTALDGAGGVDGTGETFDVDAQMVLRSVGYRGLPLPGLPFDDRAGLIPSEEGRVLRDGAPVPGVYVTGWIKRGPTGVIGTNKHDANETVAALLSDADRLPPAARPEPDGLERLLAGRGVQVVSWSGWGRIDEAELELGRSLGRTRVKIHDRAVLLRHAAGGGQDGGDHA